MVARPGRFFGGRSGDPVKFRELARLDGRGTPPSDSRRLRYPEGATAQADSVDFPKDDSLGLRPSSALLMRLPIGLTEHRDGAHVLLFQRSIDGGQL